MSPQDGTVSPPHDENDTLPAQQEGQQEKDSPVLDVHPVHGSIHGWRDFFLHIVTITIGLFIALSLEGLIEWHHHRSLVHEAEASLGDEIRANAHTLSGADADIKREYAALKSDVDVLKEIIQTSKTPEKSNMEISFNIRGFNDLSWKTAQSTNALSYMPYATAKDYAEIYSVQQQVEDAEKQAARDAILSLAPFMNLKDNEGLSVADARSVREHVEILQAQLLLLNSLVSKLDEGYKRFLAAHSNR